MSASAVAPVSWGTPVWLSGAAEVTSVSCPDALLCVAVTESGQVVTSTDPTGGPRAWRTADIDASTPIESISCPSTTLCVAVDADAHVLTSKRPAGGASAWQSITLDLDGQNQINAVSCASTSLCIAGTSRAWILTSTDPAGGAAAWKVTGIPDPTVVPWINAGTLSCPAASMCVAAAGSADGSQTTILTSTHPAAGGSTWKASARFAHVGQVFALSCPAVSLCVATGVDTVTGHQVILSSTDPASAAVRWKLTELPIPNSGYMPLSCPTIALCIGIDGHGMVSSSSPAGGSSAWQTTYAAIADVSVMSCASRYLCIAGLGTDITGGIAVGTAPIPTTTTLRLSAPTVRYRHEGAERLTVTVRPLLAQRVPGRVTITSGKKTICKIYLTRDTGACTLWARQLKHGTYQLHARYAGSKYFKPSNSRAARLTIK